jgi:hypothetical protein
LSPRVADAQHCHWLDPDILFQHCHGLDSPFSLFGGDGNGDDTHLGFSLGPRLW